MADIYIFGDSITQGAWDELGGWADRIKQYFNVIKLQDISKQSTSVFNLGISGNTADDIAFRIKSETHVRYERNEPLEDVFIVAIGVNDSRSKGSIENLVSTPEHYREKLQEIVEVIHEFSSKVLFVGLTPVDDSKTLGRDGTQYWNERVAEFDKALKIFCAEQNYPLVEIFETMQQLDWRPLFPDGLHPNTKGHQWMFEQIKPYALNMLETK